MDDLEKLLAFNKLVMYETEDRKKELAAQFNIDYNEFQRRMKGKYKEADFVALMKSLGILKHFVALDEGMSHITGEYTPDFEIEMTDGCKMFLEVKHTDEEIYKISGGNLKNRIDFAQRHEMPLRFAVSIKGMWGLFTSETLQAKKGKIELNDMLGEKSCSCLDRELETCSYLFAQPMRIQSTYEKNNNGDDGIRFEPYGKLTAYEIFCGDKKIFSADEKSLGQSIFLEALHDRLANSCQKIDEKGDCVIINESSDEPQFIREYEFLLSPLSHMCKTINSDKVRYTSQIAISERDFCFLPVRVLRAFLSCLVENGLELIVFKDNAGYKFQDYAKNFWTK